MSHTSYLFYYFRSDYIKNTACDYFISSLLQYRVWYGPYGTTEMKIHLYGYILGYIPGY